MPSKRKIGIGCIVAPFVSLVLILISWSILSFSAARIALSGTSPGASMTAIRILNSVLGFLGILSVVAIPIGLLVGIILLAIGDTKKPEPPPSIEPPLAPPLV